MAELRCSHCGGPLTVRKDQHVVLPTATITLGGDDLSPGKLGRVTEVRDDAWCGPCLADWDERMGVAGP